MLQRRKRAGKDLDRRHLLPVRISIRRLEKLVDSLGIASLWKSQVIVMAKGPDAHVEAFRS